MHPAAPSQPSYTRRRLVCSIAGFALAAGAAHAQVMVPRIPVSPPAIEIIEDDPELALPEPPNSGRTVDELVTALDSPSLQIRQAAHAELETRRDITLRQLEQALDRTDLSPEQRVRLDTAALTRFSESPRAAMGITWNMELSEVASIVNTDERFDAHTKLQPGDIFVAIDGLVVDNIEPHSFVRRQIISREPGEMLHLTVLRGKQVLDVDLRLGSFEMLRAGGMPPSKEDIVAAFRMRADRRGHSADGPSLGLTKDDWTEACIDSKKRFAVQMQQWRIPARGPLVAGGAPRSGPDDDREQYRRMASRQQVQPTRFSSRSGMPRSVINLEDPLERQVASRPMSMPEVIKQTEQTVARLRRLVENPLDDARRPGMGVVQGQNLRMLEAATPEVRLAAAERVLEALKARAAESGEVVEKHERDDPKNQK